LRKAAEDAGQYVVALDRALEEELTRSIELCPRLTRSWPDVQCQAIQRRLQIAHRGNKGLRRITFIVARQPV
jgi:hypothetical protein